MRLRLACGLLLATVLGGCADLGYYAQSMRGQLDLLARRESIEELLAAPQTPAALKDRLRLAQRLRDFASRELGLPDNASYRSYVPLGRRYVVWSVFAAPELELRPLEWCFPVVGCLSYRGYFSEAAARNFGAHLADEGYDVYVAGVSAYSTLGWLDDPLLSTQLNRSDARLAAVIFHELAHQRLYIRDDTEFNESFAVTVEHAGVRRWLAGRGSPAQRAEYAQWLQRQARFDGLLATTRARLAEIYGGPGMVGAKRAAKAAAIAELKARYAALRHGVWAHFDGYDAWIGGDINNARLLAIATYHDLVPAFETLLASLNGDLPTFYRAAGILGALPTAARKAALEGLRATPERLPLSLGGWCPRCRPGR